MSIPPPPPPENFPVQTTPTVDGEGVITGVVAQLDLTELAAKLTPRLADPDSAFTSSEVIPRPPAAKQTSGPHRYTIYVPYNDGAQINVGAAHWPFSPGIGMSTKTTISLNAREATPTFLNLGDPPTCFGPLGGVNAGYNLHTDGSSNHIAKLQVAIGSQKEGIGLTAAQSVVLHSNKGEVSLEAAQSVALKGKKITMNATSGEVINAAWYEQLAAVALTVVDAADFAAPLAGHKGGNAEQAVAAGSSGANFIAGLIPGNAKKLKEQWIAAAADHVGYVLSHVATLASLGLSFKKTWKEPKKGASAWEIKSTKFQYVVSTVAEMVALYKDYPRAADPADPGSVSIEAESTIGISANGGITINGKGGVAMTGFKGVSMGGLSTSMKGHKEATIFGGLGASMKSLAGDVAMASDLKGATVKGKKDVEMSSEAGKATFTGHLDTQLNSVTQKAYVHGTTGVTAVAGGGDGFGMVATGSKVEIGAVTSAKEFASAASDAGKTSALFDASQVRLQSTADSKLTITKNGVTIKTKAAGINSSGKIYLKGSIVELN